MPAKNSGKDRRQGSDGDKSTWRIYTSIERTAQIWSIGWSKDCDELQCVIDERVASITTRLVVSAAKQLGEDILGPAKLVKYTLSSCASYMDGSVMGCVRLAP